MCRQAQVGSTPCEAEFSIRISRLAVGKFELLLYLKKKRV
jgi:hypothetical protein